MAIRKISKKKDREIFFVIPALGQALVMEGSNLIV
jgi:hypothetical protein